LIGVSFLDRFSYSREAQYSTPLCRFMSPGTYLARRVFFTRTVNDLPFRNDVL
jgi:hypothetical protein